MIENTDYTQNNAKMPVNNLIEIAEEEDEYNNTSPNSS